MVCRRRRGWERSLEPGGGYGTRGSVPVAARKWDEPTCVQPNPAWAGTN
jgi:hypothetical protein